MILDKGPIRTRQNAIRTILESVRSDSGLSLEYLYRHTNRHVFQTVNTTEETQWKDIESKRGGGN
jgi:hypothetical protein